MLSESGKRLGNAWLYLTAALILHVLDEAIHNFLDVYLETVFAISAKLPGLPLPIFTVSSWITMLVVLTAFLLLLAPFAYREQGPIRLYAKVFAVIMLLNGLVHLLGSVVFNRLLPGIYSSPLLLLFALLLFRRAAARAPLQST
ncbi:MAG: HXXEE domain-containing protein [bacterium]|nr:HXXEE domain-containing protein [bacterium]